MQPVLEEDPSPLWVTEGLSSASSSGSCLPVVSISYWEEARLALSQEPPFSKAASLHRHGSAKLLEVTSICSGPSLPSQVGYPNVGKSSTINTILGKKKVSVSATPGRTKHFQVLRGALWADGRRPLPPSLLPGHPLAVRPPPLNLHPGKAWHLAQERGALDFPFCSLLAASFFSLESPGGGKGAPAGSPVSEKAGGAEALGWKGPWSPPGSAVEEAQPWASLPPLPLQEGEACPDLGGGALQTLFVEPSLCLCDCPGLVMPSFVSTKAEMVCSGILPIDQLRDHVPPVTLISFLGVHHGRAGEVY